MGIKDIFKRKLSEAELRKQAIIDRYMARAQDEVKKDLMFRDLQGSNLNYAIIEDLIKAANFAGTVKVRISNATAQIVTEIIIENPLVRADLNRLDEARFYQDLPTPTELSENLK